MYLNDATSVRIHSAPNDLQFPICMISIEAFLSVPFLTSEQQEKERDQFWRRYYRAIIVLGISQVTSIFDIIFEGRYSLELITLGMLRLYCNINNC